MIARLGLGCGRLVGGAEARRSRGIVEAALAVGIRHFDTAPPYGLGTADDVLGEVLVGVGEVSIATKVGIPRPRAAGFLAWARRLARPAVRRMGARRLVQVGVASTTPGARFDRAHLERSLNDSLRRLRRDSVELLLLHDPNAAGIEQAGEFLDTMRATSTARQVGVAFNGDWTDAAPAGEVIQARWRPSTGSSANRIGHGVLRHFGGVPLFSAPHLRQAAAAAIEGAAGDPDDRRQRAALMIGLALDESDYDRLIVSFSDAQGLRDVCALLVDGGLRQTRAYQSLRAKLADYR